MRAYSPPGVSVSPAYRFLHDVADDLSSGDVSFPTFLDATLKVRMALNSPALTVDALARIVVSEPLLSVKVVRLANSVALNASGKPVSDVKSAVIRVGFASIRTLAITVAMEQLLQAKDLEPYLEKARALWEHSLEVAALAYVIARRLTNFNPHEALFAGLVHDIGQFYLLSRAAKRPELASSDLELSRLMFEWHASVGNAVLSALGVPEEILRAVDEHELGFNEDTPRTLAQVIYLANRVSGNRNPFVDEEDIVARPGHAGGIRLARHVLNEVVTESREELNSILAALH